MLDLLLSHLPSLATVLSALLGGGGTVALVKAWNAYWTQKRKNEAQEHDQDIELSEHLEQRLTKVEGRLDAAEEELRSAKQKLTRARIREDELTAAVEALIDRVDKLLDRLEEHEQITEEERQRLTSPPYVDLNGHSNKHKEHGSSS